MKVLADILHKSHSLPFLFVGSGLSMRYLSTKTWGELLRYFAQLVDRSDYSFEKYETKAKHILTEQKRKITKNSLYTTVADLIEHDFNLLWYESDDFRESREENKNLIRRGVSPFKIEIANHLKRVNLKNTPDVYKREIELLKRLGKKSIAGVITTNYDCFLEYIYNDFNVYVGQEELLFSPTYGISEIYKIHGCCKKPETIVINSEDYLNFDKKNAYLAAKLMTIFVEHPIIFIGYSLEDENIQAILKSIVDCLSNDNLQRLKDRLIFIEWKQGKKEMEFVNHSRDFGQGKTITMTKIVTDSFEPLFEIISENKSKYSTSFFRKLKRDIYELALTSEPTERIVVMPLSEEKMENEEEPEVVIGFGILELGKQGYKGLSADEIFLDVVFDNRNFNQYMVVEEALPVIGKHVAWSLPVFKYIRGYQKELPPELQRFINFTFDDFITKTILLNREKYNFSSISHVLNYEPENLSRQVRFLQTLKEDQIDIDELGEYLKNTLTNYPDLLHQPKNSEAKTGIKKLIRMYDYLKYKE